MIPLMAQAAVVIGPWVAMIAALAAAFSSLRNRRAIGESKAQIQEIRVMIDGRLTQLLEVSSALARSEGGTAALAAEKVQVAEAHALVLDQAAARVPAEGVAR